MGKSKEKWGKIWKIKLLDEFGKLQKRTSNFSNFSLVPKT